MKFSRVGAAALSNWRDRLLSNPRFQRRSLRLPFVGWIARRRMRALFDLCSGFVYSQVLLACTRLGLFAILARCPRSLEELVHDLDLPYASVDRLVTAAESLQLVEARGRGRFGLGPLGAALMGNPAVVRMIEHHCAFYMDLSDPVALLRGEQGATELGRFWSYSGSESPKSLGRGDTTAYSDLMAASQAMLAEHVLSAYSIRRHRRLLDIGGGAGAFVGEALVNHPRLEACVFDLPPVVELAREHFGKFSLGDRAQVVGGDFLSDPVPGGFDLISLIRVLHDHDDGSVLRLLRAIREAIAPDGVLLIAEPLLHTRGAEPVSAAYFGFYLLAMGQGKPRGFDEIGTLLSQAGFAPPKEHRSSAPLLARVMTTRPSRKAQM